MKRILCIIMSALMLVMAMAGCGRSDKKEIEELITSIESDINNIMLEASPMHDMGSIGTELYMEIVDVKNKFTEAKNNFETTDGEQDQEILESLKQCRETVDELKGKTDEIKKSAEESLSKTAGELKDIAANLSQYMEEGLEKGYLDQARLDEFNNLAARIDEIISSGDISQAVNEELDTIRETLAVMASQCAAPNSIIDELTGIVTETTQAPASETTTAAASDTGADTTASQEAESAQADLQGLIENYSLLQNEASQKFDMGDIDEDNYMTLIQAGTTLAVLKEEVEKNGQSDAVNKRIADCQKQIKNIAEGMGSELASKF